MNHRDLLTETPAAKKTSPPVAVATMAMLQRYFDELLLMRLVAAGSLQLADARSICIQTATFAHELADDANLQTVADLMAVNYEQMSNSFGGNGND